MDGIARAHTLTHSQTDRHTHTHTHTHAHARTHTTQHTHTHTHNTHAHTHLKQNTTINNQSDMHMAYKIFPHKIQFNNSRQHKSRNTNRPAGFFFPRTEQTICPARTASAVALHLQQESGTVISRNGRNNTPTTSRFQQWPVRVWIRGVQLSMDGR